MEIERRLKALERIFITYDDFLRGRETACRMHCHHCCTTRVSVTTLEAWMIRERLTPGALEGMERRLAAARALERYRPKLTTNALAELCARDAEFPAEDGNAGAAEGCPLLAEELCSVYALRPFNCRCFVSRTPCAPEGGAEVDDYTLAVNTVFLQAIEHLDAGGCSGNLLDVLEALGSADKRSAYTEGALHCTGNGLIPNHPLTVLMLPPEHRSRLEPILQTLRSIRL